MLHDSLALFYILTVKWTDCITFKSIEKEGRAACWENYSQIANKTKEKIYEAINYNIILWS